MKHVLRVLLIAGWVCVVGAASAATLAPTRITPIKPITGIPVETTPVHHEPRTSGPIVVKYRFTKAPGFVNLIVNTDGTYLFSGAYMGKPPFTPTGGITYDFSVMLALKSTLGGMILFQYTGLDNGNVQWSKQGKSGVLKDDFKTFSGPHDWAVTYRVSLTPSGARSLSSFCNWLESTFGNEWVNSKGQVMFGWSPGEYAEWKGDGC